ncbi:hypothetical protein EDC04DRAFT_2633938 [Pisolithus marmoratus]|nr:hypothetical protein EDC04DRAFT_2633938 [Pisolithus marmoratus]
MAPKSFSPRPFPPPALSGVPLEYIINQLHNLAPRYWNRPETADCIIIVPTCSRLRQLPPSPSAASNATPHLTLQLHVDYLSAKSSLLRGFFSGVSSPEHSQSTQSPYTVCESLLSVPSGSPVPRLLDSCSSHPVLLLPVPDPRSIHLLIHWIYFGETDHIEACLKGGVVNWEGLARNAEYLGLSADIKVFLGQWYCNWLLPVRGQLERCPNWSEEDSDDGSGIELELGKNEAEETPDNVACSAAAAVERGRSRIVRPLTRLSGNPKVHAAA